MTMKTVLITGAAGSLGSALSLAAAGRGMGLVLVDRDRGGLEQLYDHIVESRFGEPALQVMDLSTTGPDEVQSMLAAVVGEFGGLDALVHCAARFDALTPIEHVPPEEWLVSLQVNLNAAWLLSALSLPLLRESADGRLYFMLEDLAEVGGPLWGPYGASKHALHAMVGQFAADCQSTGVQVLGINPGPMQSPLRARAFLAENPSTLPPPARAAEQIVELMTGERLPSSVYVDLGASA